MSPKKEYRLKYNRIAIALYYFIFAINILCEVGCDPECDPSQSITTISVEECDHPSCELSHQDQHNYVKDDSSSSAQKKLIKFIKHILPNISFEIVHLESFHLDESIQRILSNSEIHFFQDQKRYLIFQRLIVFNS